MRLKLLLDVYSDEVNAQNINGLNIAKYVDPARIEPHMLYHNIAGNEENIKFHRIPNKWLFEKIYKFLFLLSSNYDIYYMPRVGKVELLFGYLCGKHRRIITTVELESIFKNDYKRKFFQKHVTSIISINNLLKEHLKTIWGLESKLLYLGYDDQGIAKANIDKLKQVAFVGSLIERKHPEHILSLAKIHRDIVFVFIGDGPMLSELKKSVLTNKLDNVEFKGKVSNQKVYEILRHCGLLLIASENEGQPKVSLEAGAVGVPTCYIRTNYEIDHVINNQTGFVVNNLEEMSDLLEKLKKNPDILRCVSDNIYEEAQKYSWHVLGEKYTEYFETISLQKPLSMVRS